jgi:flagellar biosynthesis/type III secretory pathway protein FliH
MSKPILIGNKIKPRSRTTRTEHIHGVPYVFADLNKDGHFITEVKIAAHAELMLSQPGHFYPYPPDVPRLSRDSTAAAAAAAAAAAEAGRLAKIEQEAREAADEAQRKADAEAAEAAAEAAARAKAESEGQGGAPAPDAAALADVISSATPELIAEAKAFLAGEPKKMATALQKLSGMSAIKVALAIESGEQKRPPVLKVLNDALALAGEQPA